MFICKFSTKEISKFTNNIRKRLQHNRNSLRCQWTALCFYSYLSNGVILGIVILGHMTNWLSTYDTGFLNTWLKYYSILKISKCFYLYLTKDVPPFIVLGSTTWKMNNLIINQHSSCQLFQGKYLLVTDLIENHYFPTQSILVELCMWPWMLLILYLSIHLLK